MSYFSNIKSYEDLKKQYRQLALNNHPDCGGSEEIMKAINSEYDMLFPVWKMRSNIITTETAESTRSEFYTQNGWKGKNYNSSLSLKKIAKIIRNYVKEIYPTYKFSVTTEYASMCCELHVALVEAPQDAYKTPDEYTDEDKEQIRRKGEDYKPLNEITAAVLKDVDAHVNSYNYSDCDGMIDYFDVNFYYFNCKIGTYEKPFKVVERTARIKSNTKTNTKETAINTEVKEQPAETTTETNNNTTLTLNNYQYTITADIDTRDNSALWVLKVIDKLTDEQFKTVKAELKPFGGYYSKFKHGFIFKADPTNELKQDITSQEQPQTEATEQQTDNNNFNLTAETIIDYSTEIISSMNISGDTIVDNEQYKRALEKKLKANTIAITADIIEYIKKDYENLAEVLEEISSPYWQPEIEDGFIYSCYFKAWNLEIEAIKTMVDKLNIKYSISYDKIFFMGLTAEQARQVKAISDENGSIFFIDEKKEQQTNNIIEGDFNLNQNDNSRQELTDNDYAITFDIPFTAEELNKHSEQQAEQPIQSDIFSKFDNITIDNNKRIDNEDQAFCEAEQEQYNSAIGTLNKLVSILKTDLNINLGTDSSWTREKSNNKYLGAYELREITERFTKIKESFIHNIIGHFTQKYNITIDSYKTVEKYENQEVNYNTLLDEVFETLGGFSFNEKAVKEIKDTLKEKVKGWHDTLNVAVKNNKVALKDYVYIDDFDKKWGHCRISYNSKKSINTLLTAVSHFDQGSTDNCYTVLENTIDNEEGDNVFTEHSLSGIKILSLKVYKNGKIDITFKNNQLAKQFAQDYCGYNASITKEKATA